MQGNNLGPCVSGLLTSWEGPTDVFGQCSQRTGLGGKQKHKAGGNINRQFWKEQIQKNLPSSFFFPLKIRTTELYCGSISD